MARRFVETGLIDLFMFSMVKMSSDEKRKKWLEQIEKKMAAPAS